MHKFNTYYRHVIAFLIARDVTSLIKINDARTFERLAARSVYTAYKSDLGGHCAVVNGHVAARSVLEMSATNARP